MRKFVFSLEKVLSLRQKELDIISREYMECMHRLNQLKEHLHQLQHQVMECELERVSSLQQSVSGQALKAIRYKEESLKHCVQEMMLKVNTVETQAQYILTRRQAKKKEVNGLEKLREKQKQVFEAEVIKQTESNIDALFNYTNHIKKM